MAEPTDFLRAIIDNPDDDSLRLIFADWLEERGDPRAEFIRIQCELARQCPSKSVFLLSWPGRDRNSGGIDGRLWSGQRQLLVRYEKVWLGSLHRLLKGWRFHRGFVDQAAMGVRQFLEHAETVFSLSPIQHLKLTGGHQAVAQVAQSPLLLRLRTFWYESPWSSQIDDSAAQALAFSPFVKNLDWLVLQRNQIGVPGALALATSPYLQRTVYIDLFDSQVTPSGRTELQSILGDRAQYWRF